MYNPPRRYSLRNSLFPEPTPEDCVNATYALGKWNEWVEKINKEKQMNASNPKLIDPEFDNQNIHEININLSLFIDNVRKDSGRRYPPTLLYYLCLGIDACLTEKNKGGLFVEPAYHKFLCHFNNLINQSSKYIFLNAGRFLSLLQHDYFWNNMHLGQFNPQVLLFTLVYMNTQYFDLNTIEHHLDVSFKDIELGRHRTLPVYDHLHFFHEYSNGQERTYCKRVTTLYGEHLDTIHCPIQNYNFYFSKCPESVKNTSVGIYLKPKKNFEYNDKVWFTTSQLRIEELQALVNRALMIKGSWRFN